MQNKIILASKSKVRKDILDKNNIKCVVEPSNVDEDPVKESLIKTTSKLRNNFKKFSRIERQTKLV